MSRGILSAHLAKQQVYTSSFFSNKTCIISNRVNICIIFIKFQINFVSLEIQTCRVCLLELIIRAIAEVGCVQLLTILEIDVWFCIQLLPSLSLNNTTAIRTPALWLHYKPKANILAQLSDIAFLRNNTQLQYSKIDISNRSFLSSLLLECKFYQLLFLLLNGPIDKEY